jgi:NADH:ubiquinone reductase (H+-translocating)
LGAKADVPGRFTAVVVGAGLTGLETATELPFRLKRVRDAAGSNRPVRVVLVDRLPYIGSDMGQYARPVIEDALRGLNIERRLGASVNHIEPTKIVMDSGETIETCTVIWCGGMRANPLTAEIAGRHDKCGRLEVDQFLQVSSIPNAFGAGDCCNVPIDGQRPSVMSCQHGRPMGKYAGHNAVADLFGLPLLRFQIDWYVTVLDLGPWGGVYTGGWDRKVIGVGKEAKATKQEINRNRIYPPRSFKREDLFAAAQPIIPSPPYIESTGRSKESVI